MPREDHFGDITVSGNISLSATTTILPEFTPARIASIRIAGESGIETIQNAIDDITSTSPGLVVIPSDYSGAEPTSIPDNISILDLRLGVSATPLTAIDAEQSGLLIRRYLNKTQGASTLRTTGVQGDNPSVAVFEAFPTSNSQGVFGLRSGVFIGTPRESGSTNSNHVAIYGEAQRATGSDGIWGLNTITEVQNLDGATIGYEIDINNRSGSDPGVSPANSFWGLSIVSGDTGRSGTGIVINRNGAFSNNEWNRGIYIKEVVSTGRALEFGTSNARIYTGKVIEITGLAKDLLKFVPTDDVTPTDAIFFVANAADSQANWRVNKDGSMRVGDNIEIDGNLNHDGSNVGFYGITPADRPGATEDIKDGLTTLGLLQGTSATPLDLDGGKLTCGNQIITNGNGLVVGHTAKIDFGAIPEFQVLGTGAPDSSCAFGRWSNNAGSATLRFLKSRNAPIGSNTIVQDGDELGRIRFQAADGTDFNTNAAEISAEVDGTPGLNDMPGRILFSTTLNGSSSVTERMRITNDGKVGIGGTPATSAILDLTSTTGAFLSPRMTTTQRDALTATNGMIIYNTTDNQMQGRINGSWAAM